MTAALIVVIAEALIGGAVVSAECRGCHEYEQVAVAATVRHRVQASGLTGVAVMAAPYQYATPARPELVTWRHVAAYARGRWGDAPEWAEGATHFVARRIDARVSERWARRGLVPVESGPTAHVFYAPRG